AVEAQCAGRRSAALVERGDETALVRNLCHHLVIGHDRHPPPGAGMFTRLDRLSISIRTGIEIRAISVVASARCASRGGCDRPSGPMAREPRPARESSTGGSW